MSFDICKLNKRRILITGHTGFKGSWLCRILADVGASITGYALKPEAKPNLFLLSGIEKDIDSVIGDVRDYELLHNTFERVRPEIVIHMAAQPIVRKSYVEPRMTYETNVTGTVNICECIRTTLVDGRPCVRSFVNVTTDKVYENTETGSAFTEEMPLDGYDPYSNSKSCAELVTHSYDRSFLRKLGVAVSTARAGNVIGGGDFSADRIVPDCTRAVLLGEPIIVRNPVSVRPYQHVLEPLFAYLMIADAQERDISIAGSYNIGPDDADCVTTGEIVDLFVRKWGDGAVQKNIPDEGPHEAGLLRLNCDKLKQTFHWTPRWNVEQAVEKTVEWVRVYQEKPESIVECMRQQIREYQRRSE